MKKHLPFLLQSFFSTLAVIIAIVLPQFIGGCIVSNTWRQIIGAVSGVVISITGSWFTYYQTNKDVGKLKTALKYKEDEEGNPSVTANPEWEQF